MGSRPRWGISGYDAIITTKKGSEALGGAGAIIIANYMYLNKPEINEYVKEHPHYIAKHCDNVNEITHIYEDGFVNRYGYYFTKTKLDFSKGPIKVGAGYFTIKHFNTPQEMIDYVDSITA